MRSIKLQRVTSDIFLSKLGILDLGVVALAGWGGLNIWSAAVGGLLKYANCI